MHPTEIFELVFILLLAILILHWLAGRAGLPASVALLIGGGALAFVPGLPAIELDPELVLVLFLPPLLMDGAYFTAIAPFRRQIAGILSLAVGAVVFTTLVVGLAVHWLVPGLPWAACFALGAIVSPPDAVSARAVLQRVRLPRRLTTLLEGESLLNDASGLVLFRFAVAAALTGSFDAVDAGMQFAWLAVGGIIVGGLIGGLWMVILHRLRDDMLTTAASLILCWAAYLGGEALHVSGVISTVTAGLVFGWYQHVVFTAGVRIRSSAFWHVMVFLFEAMIFILIGLSLRGVLERVGGFEVVLSTMAVPVAGIIVAMTLARFAWVFGCDAAVAALRRLTPSSAMPLGSGSAFVLSWAGMRGVVTLAVALTVPETMPGRDLMLVAAFAAILVTVLFQGTTLGLVIRAAGLTDRGVRPPLSLGEAEAAVARAQLGAVAARAHAPDGTLVHPRLLDTYTRRAEQTANYMGNEDTFGPAIMEHFDIVVDAVKAGRMELVRLHRAHQIDDETLHDLERDLDLEELAARAAMTV
ncbi:Na+/H+ antiporter [Aureimonas sp. AU22]|uniref:Na+/H+ antiporter n=1 Tax=Aureimonas sp. AU22 TaxID=1638162 RepID=UPI0007855DD5|nr:Na+/H+ antiporter [Aureimonas sp. AU22]